VTATEGHPDPRIEKILVALDASPHSRAALRAAINLAGRLGSELEGLFVEDALLVSPVGGAFAREVGLHTGRARRLGPGELERQVRAERAWAKRKFQAAAERAHLRGRFAVARGRVAHEVVRRASEADLLILGKRSSSLVIRGRMGSTARAVLAQATSMALLVEADACLGPPTVVVFDGEPGGSKALRTALRVTDPGEELVVLVAGQDADGHRALRDRARSAMDRDPERVRYRRLDRAGIAHLASALEEERCGLLVLPSESPALTPRTLAELLEQLDVPVLVVR